MLAQPRKRRGSANGCGRSTRRRRSAKQQSSTATPRRSHPKSNRHERREGTNALPRSGSSGPARPRDRLRPDPGASCPGSARLLFCPRAGAGRTIPMAQPQLREDAVLAADEQAGAPGRAAFGRQCDRTDEGRREDKSSRARSTPGTRFSPKAGLARRPAESRRCVGRPGRARTRTQCRLGRHFFVRSEWDATPALSARPLRLRRGRRDGAATLLVAHRFVRFRRCVQSLRRPCSTDMAASGRLRAAPVICARLRIASAASGTIPSQRRTDAIQEDDQCLGF